MKLTPKQAWECFTEEAKKYKEYSAMSPDGNWSFYSAKPLLTNNGWDYMGIWHIDCSFNIDWSGDWKDSLHYKGMRFIRGHYTCDSFNCTEKHIMSDCFSHSVCDLFLYDEENDLSYCNEKCYEEHHANYKGKPLNKNYCPGTWTDPNVHINDSRDTKGRPVNIPLVEAQLVESGIREHEERIKKLEEDNEHLRNVLEKTIHDHTLCESTILAPYAKHTAETDEKIKKLEQDYQSLYSEFKTNCALMNLLNVQIISINNRLGAIELGEK